MTQSDTRKAPPLRSGGGGPSRSDGGGGGSSTNVSAPSTASLRSAVPLPRSASLTGEEPNANPLLHHALRLGDDALILGQRLSEWCGHAPMLEVDLALANIGLDLLGQATHFLNLAGEVEGKGRDADALAFHRDVLDFRNCLLVEQPNGDFAQTIARQFLFSNWQELLMGEIARAPEPRLSAIGAKAVKEIAYHAKFASEWVVRLGDGTDESRARMIAGLDWMWRFVDELFDVKDGAPSHRAEWDARINRTLSEAGLEVPKPRRGVMGGRAGHHSEHLGHLLTEMQFLQRAYPGAAW